MVSNLIIGGTTRAGTTSLFKYLAAHPDICQANIKETRFFLDKDYPLPRRYFYDEGLERYKEYFAHCSPGKVLLEATPDYLYSPGAAKRIQKALPAARLVFILRDPISRLVSWYRYARQFGDLAPTVSFEEYVKLQLDTEVRKEPAPQYLRVLEQGCYSKYLPFYLEYFTGDQMRVFQYEVLQQSPRVIVQKICQFIDIDDAFYDNYQFEVHNRSRDVRNVKFELAYRGLGIQMRKLVDNHPLIRGMLHQIRYALLEPIYLRLNYRPDEAVIIPPQLRSFLAEYYQNESQAIARLLGLPGWSRQPSGEMIK